MTKKEWLYNYLTEMERIDRSYGREGEWYSCLDLVRAANRAFHSGEIESPILMRKSLRSHDRSIEVYDLIREINDDENYPIVIMQKNALFKAVSAKEEGIEYLNGSLKKRALTALKRYWKQYRKICEDGQFDIFVQDFIKGVAK